MSDSIVAVLFALITLASKLVDFIIEKWRQAQKTVTVVMQALFP